MMIRSVLILSVTALSLVAPLAAQAPAGWEVRVDLGEGSDRVFIYSTDPGFSVGELVRLENGRITRLYPRRPYSPA